MFKRNKRLLIVIVMLIIGVFGWMVLSNWRAVGTQMANPMRQLLGKERVAQLESLVFDVQDRIKRWQYGAGLEDAKMPSWALAVTPSLQAAFDKPTAIPLPTETPLSATPTPAQGSDTNLVTDSSPSPTQVPTVTFTPTPAAWTLPNLKPFGNLPNEGVWQPYIHAPSGDVVAVRTFLQPDPERSYAVVAVVGMDLSQLDLHFVLGLKEPAMPDSTHGQGIIPFDDRQPGKLLAAFNGGFIAEHGYYGAMADGVTTLGARAGFATLAIYKDGSVSTSKVRLGEWGTDLTESRDYQAYRQNALMIVHNGEINEKVDDGNYIDWGANLDGAIVTIRSGLGLSEDNNVLYYFAGPSLSMPVLADAMLAAGAYNSMLLDINPTHAHFASIYVEDEKLTAEALYPEIMDLWVERYLGQWDADFFYLTVKEVVQ